MSVIADHSLATREIHDSRPRAVLNQHGKSFGFAGRFMGRELLQDCARLYRFCRYVDDITDLTINLRQTQSCLQQINTYINSGTSQDRVVADFIQLMGSKEIPGPLVQALLAGFEQDLQHQPVASLDQLKRYCYRVASTVGLMMCRIMGVKDPKAYPFAVDLGLAMQLTNIARDVYEDAQNDRIYLPTEWLGIDQPEQIIAASQGQKVAIQSAVAKILVEAERYYRSAELGLCYIPPKARLAIHIAATLYRHIGTEISRMDFAVWQGRAYVSKPKKVLLALQALTVFSSQRKFRYPTARHNAHLHQALQGLPDCHLTTSAT